MRTKVFVSYSHQDASWLLRLRVHLRPLEREHTIELWDDTLIKPGSRWKQAIEDALASTRVAILLISADFLASDFIVEDELPPLLMAAERDGATVLPLIVSPSRFLRTTLAQFQAVNHPDRALVKLSKGEQEEILVEVAERIEALFAPPPVSRAEEARSQTEGGFGEVTNRDGVEQLASVPLIVYFDKARDEAKLLWESMANARMKPHKLEPGLGSAGARTIVHRAGDSKRAEWIKDNVRGLKRFTLHTLSPKDPFKGVIVNLW